MKRKKDLLTIEVLESKIFAEGKKTPCSMAGAWGKQRRGNLATKTNVDKPDRTGGKIRSGSEKCVGSTFEPAVQTTREEEEKTALHLGVGGRSGKQNNGSNGGKAGRKGGTWRYSFKKHSIVLRQTLARTMTYC